jgi:hypothetical protein
LQVSYELDTLPNVHYITSMVCIHTQLNQWSLVKGYDICTGMEK